MLNSLLKYALLILALFFSFSSVLGCTSAFGFKQKNNGSFFISVVQEVEFGHRASKTSDEEANSSIDLAVVAQDE